MDLVVAEQKVSLSLTLCSLSFKKHLKLHHSPASSELCCPLSQCHPPGTAVLQLDSENC